MAPSRPLHSVYLGHVACGVGEGGLVRVGIDPAASGHFKKPPPLIHLSRCPRCGDAHPRLKPFWRRREQRDEDWEAEILLTVADTPSTRYDQPEDEP